MVGYYTARWWIEEYHKALKSGAGVEASQLERADRLEPLIAVLAVVAVRLLNAKLLARSRPDSFEAAASFGPECWYCCSGGWASQGGVDQSESASRRRAGGRIYRPQKRR